MNDDGSFVLSRADWRRMWLSGQARLGFEVVEAVVEDEDCFTEHGSEFAADRWADDGGRA